MKMNDIEKIKTLENKLKEKELELKEIAKNLLDPNFVHQNMLLGKIAKIPMEACAHTHGSKTLERWLAFEGSKDNENLASGQVLREMFTSANDVPVTRVVIDRQRYMAMLKGQ